MRPKARKALALLAIVGLSIDGPVSRLRIAALLWSSSEPSVRLARLRDILHGLRNSLGQGAFDILDVSSNAIGFRPGCVQLQIEAEQHLVERNSPTARFLADIEGIDPALDHWLNNLRLKHKTPGNVRADDIRQFKSQRDQKPCTLAVTAVSVVGTSSDVVAIADLPGRIAGALIRHRWFRTITRGASGEMLKLGCQELSDLADYVLFSTIKMILDRYELFVELVAYSCDPEIVWTSTFDLDEDSSTDSRSSAIEVIAARVDSELLAAETRRHGHVNIADDASSYQLVLRAIPAIYQLERDSFLYAGHLIESSVELNQSSSFSRSWLAYWYIFLVGQGWARNPGQAMTKAWQAADRAMLLDPRDARGFAVAGHVRAFIGKHLDEAEALHNIALRLNPYLPLAWHLAGMTSAYAGRLDEAQKRVGRCLSLSSDDAGSFFSEAALAIVYLLMHEHEKSVEIGTSVTQRHPNFTSSYKSTIAALGHLGRVSAARRLLHKLQQLEPQFTLRSFQFSAPYRRRDDLAHFVAGLRLAGVT